VLGFLIEINSQLVVNFCQWHHWGRRADRSRWHHPGGWHPNEI